MHEWSICETLVRSIDAELAARGVSPGRLRKARVVIGGLRQIVPAHLVSAYEALTKNTPTEGSAIETNVRPVRTRCESCGREGDLPSAGGFSCAACGSERASLLGGTELYLESLEIEEAEGECAAAPR